MGFKKNLMRGMALAGFAGMAYMSDEMARTAYEVARGIENER
ncbi:hypothetical protein [Bifidobacterium pluvialisilvae]|nr:hypothetical protein [Bifidobacterium pluvialisilvae]